MLSGDQWGHLLTITTFGESHGPMMGVVVGGVPAGMSLCAADFEVDLARRAPGRSRYTAQRHEPDQVRLVSGVFEGKTTGAPLALLIENQDVRSKDYQDLQTVFRPGHADYTYHKKYVHRDYRGGGRASARETVCRVAAGVIAKRFLAQTYGVQVRGYVAALGDQVVPETDSIDWDVVASNPFHCPCADLVPAWAARIKALRRAGDSIGARVVVLAESVPVGLGRPTYHKLDADIAAALMGIPAVKGVEIGAGFAAVAQLGSTYHDALYPNPDKPGEAQFVSHRSGGILGGISTGQPIQVQVAFKPTPSIRVPQDSIDIAGKPTSVVTLGRHDPCVGLRAVPVVEAMLALVLMDHALLRRSEC